jgi:hypothetical protein
MTAPIADTRQAGGASSADIAREYGPYDGGRSGQGWLPFAGTIVALVGCMNLVYGLAAVTHSKVLPRHPDVVLTNLKTWGWVTLGFGLLQIVAAIGIFAGNQLARWFGVAVLFINALGQLSFANAYPIWSLTIVGIDLLAIYGLVVHGRYVTRDST